MKAPFPYFGGKSKVADQVWQALGNPAHYLEPFFGSGAVLLNRPDYNQADHTETINDKDGFVSNVWRAIKFNPEKTAEYCDYPVNHADLIVRKKKLIENDGYLLENLCKDDEWHDVKLAGYWIWAASCWIGSGLTCPGQVPHLTHPGQGVHKKSLVTAGQLPHLTDAGAGVHQKKYIGKIYEWFNDLSARLRRVRVVCGDWSRICGGNWQDKMGHCGVFFDPPYQTNDRAAVYHQDDFNVADKVLEWSKKRGDKKSYRIVIAGYDEHQELIDNHGWSGVNWKAGGGYSRPGTRGEENAKKEMLYFSPHCLNIEKSQGRMF